MPKFDSLFQKCMFVAVFMTIWYAVAVGYVELYKHGPNV